MYLYLLAFARLPSPQYNSQMQPLSQLAASDRRPVGIVENVTLLRMHVDGGGQLPLRNIDAIRSMPIEVSGRGGLNPSCACAEISPVSLCLNLFRHTGFDKSSFSLVPPKHPSSNPWSGSGYCSPPESLMPPLRRGFITAPSHSKRDGNELLMSAFGNDLGGPIQESVLPCLGNLPGSWSEISPSWRPVALILRMAPPLQCGLKCLLAILATDQRLFHFVEGGALRRTVPMFMREIWRKGEGEGRAPSPVVQGMARLHEEIIVEEPEHRL